MNNILEYLSLEVLVTRVVGWLPSLLAALLILLLFWLAYRFTVGGLRAILIRTGLDRALAGMLLSLYRFGMLTFGGVMAASQLGINVGAALAGLGVVGLTIGFAAKDSLTNTIAGFLIFWDRPFSVDDWITVGGHYGKVDEITMRTTRIRTLRNTFVIVPNQKMIDEIMVNHSKHGQTRIDVPIGIAYKESIDDARAVMLEAVKQIPELIHKPPPSVVVTGLGASSVDLDVRVWIRNADDEKAVSFQIVEMCKKALDNAGIEIPFPHLQLFVDEVAGEVFEKAAMTLPLLGNGKQIKAAEGASRQGDGLTAQ